MDKRFLPSEGFSFGGVDEGCEEVCFGMGDRLWHGSGTKVKFMIFEKEDGFVGCLC